MRGQKEFAFENRSIIKSFFDVRKLDYDEYYNVAVWSYLRAVQKYLTSSELWDYRFSAIALYAMKSGLYDYRRKQRRRKRIAEVVNMRLGAMSAGK